MYSNRLNTKLVWYLNGRFVSGCQMVQYSNGGLKSGLKKACLGPKMSFHVTLPFGYRTPYCLVFRRIWYSSVECSDVYIHLI